MTALPDVDGYAPRWSALFIWTLALGLAGSGLLRLAPEWPRRAWPDFLFMAAFATALRCPGRELAVFAWCGLMRDVWLGWRWGTDTLLYLFAAWLLTVWKRRGGLADMPGTWWWAGAFALAALPARGVLAAWTPGLWRESLSVGVQAALWTGLCFPVFDWWLDAPGWRTWRRRAGAMSDYNAGRFHL